MMIDAIQLAAERIHGVPAGWRWCRLNSHGMPEDFIKVEGVVPGEYKSGPRKGKPKWGKDLQTIWVRRSEIRKMAMEWEKETGKCHVCEGSGRDRYGYSKADGAMLRDCLRCGATGSPPVISVL